MTHSEFTRILPAYMGCKVQMEKSCYWLVYTHSIMASWGDNSGSRPDLLPKLVLRSIDQMTETEMNEFGEHMQFCDMSTAEFLSEREVCAVLHNYKMASKAIRWLNQRSFDTDGLIEAGFAVKEEQL